ncbi:3950_t:CDS:2 [Paraglomus occultum]|uniref:3950_t:CDS:1 n=1 Tax=Paraglomus occultum TaxID=144539 RepID=A0A9N9FCH3_9GLOM|nr:3950_t:CDS:2 [Paraglomus occultum]
MFVLPLLIIPPTEAQSKLTYNEPTTGLAIADATADSDGTTIVCLKRLVDTQCYYYLRVFFPNNTIITPTFQLPLDVSNCVKIQMTVLTKGLLYLTYLRQIGNSSFEQYGIPVAYNGTLGVPTLLANLNDTHSGRIFKSMAPEDSGFLFVQPVANAIIWQRYSIDTKVGVAERSANGTFAPRNGSQIRDFRIFSTVNGGFSCVFSTETLNEYGAQIDNEARLELEIVFFDPGSIQVTKPTTIYTGPLGIDKITLGDCGLSFNGCSYSCLLLISTGRNQILHQVNFHSTRPGANNVDLQTASDDIVGVDKIRSLFNGGYLLLYHFVKNGQTFIKRAKMIDPEGQSVQTIPLAKPVKMIHVYPRNNTIWYWESNSAQSWSIVSYNPKYMNDDNNYQSPNVNTTTPPIGGEIATRSTTINITYNVPVKPAAGNVTIYATDGVNKYFRQSYSPIFSQYSQSDESNQTLTLDVLTSTFNQPNMTYFVTLDNGFVESMEDSEPILGISDGKWKFRTASTPPNNVYVPSETISVCLNSMGTSRFLKFSKSERSAFVSSLSNTLASFVPISPSRLSISEKFQMESYNGKKQTLLLIQVGAATSDTEMDAKSVIDDLTVLIKNKGITAVSRFPETMLIDEEFGVRIEPNFWNKYKLKIIVAAVIMLLVGLLYLLARRLNPEANNAAIFTLVLALYDFAIDFAFIVRNGQDVRPLYLPSILIFVFSILFNTTIALYIMITENMQSYKFHIWTQSCAKGAAVFTVLSAANIEVLTMTNSKLYKSDYFSAPLSEQSLKIIFWASTASFFLEDVMQFIIQIIYHNKSFIDDIVPLLTLFSSSVMLTVNLISRMYYGITLIRTRKDDVMLSDESVSGKTAARDSSKIFRIMKNELNYRRMK